MMAKEKNKIKKKVKRLQEPPMITRLRSVDKEALLQLVDELSYKTQTNMYRDMLKQFLAAAPWLRGEPWIKPGEWLDSNWLVQNFVVDAELQSAVKRISEEREIRLMTVIYTAVQWWIKKKREVIP